MSLGIVVYADYRRFSTTQYELSYLELISFEKLFY